ncbi:unnamed protein product [Lymnaea stagnalis]|uniref:Uncharacterized protein n=1 Tax=Lymnaea stagnalis TaxID=6523 RepID=A0AAV2I9E2_LYMST
MYKAVVCTLCCIFAGTMALVGKSCTSNSQCDPSECCQILNAFMVVSKRLVGASSWSPRKQPTKGTCQKYQLEGETCGTFDKMNGYCSCEPGTTCHTYEVPLDSKIQARRIAAPRPGYQWISKCEKPAT